MSLPPFALATFAVLCPNEACRVHPERDYCLVYEESRRLASRSLALVRMVLEGSVRKQAERCASRRSSSMPRPASISGLRPMIAASRTFSPSRTRLHGRSVTSSKSGWGSSGEALPDQRPAVRPTSRRTTSTCAVSGSGRSVARTSCGRRRNRSSAPSRRTPVFRGLEWSRALLCGDRRRLGAHLVPGCLRARSPGGRAGVDARPDHGRALRSSNDPKSGKLMSSVDIPALLLLLDEKELAIRYIDVQPAQTNLAWSPLMPVLDPIRCDKCFLAAVAKAQIK